MSKIEKLSELKAEIRELDKMIELKVLECTKLAKEIVEGR